MKRMSKTLRMQWEEVMDHHAPIVEATINSYEVEGDEVAYLNATLEFSALPEDFLPPSWVSKPCVTNTQLKGRALQLMVSS